jgi:hypothetical protein
MYGFLTNANLTVGEFILILTLIVAAAAYLDSYAPQPQRIAAKPRSSQDASSTDAE